MGRDLNCGHSTRSSSTRVHCILWMVLKSVGGEKWGKVSTVELFLSRLPGTTSHLDMQVIRLIGFFLLWK